MRGDSAYPLGGRSVTRLEIMKVRDMADGAPPEVELANGQVISLKDSVCLPPCWAVRIIHVCGVAINAIADRDEARAEVERLKLAERQQSVVTPEDQVRREVMEFRQHLGGCGWVGTEVFQESPLCYRVESTPMAHRTKQKVWVYWNVDGVTAQAQPPEKAVAP